MTHANDARAIAIREAARLLDAGRVSYNSSRIRQTVAQLEQAWKLAAGCGAQDIELSGRFWHGAALHGAGRLPEALAVWAPALGENASPAARGDHYMMVTRYVLVAIDLPLPLPVIENALSEVEGHIRASHGGAGPRSRLLLARSRLALARGNATESLEIGLEGLARRRVEGRSYSFSTHYRTLVTAGLVAGQPDLVAELIDDWDREELCYLECKRIALAAARANLARYNGHPDTAVALLEPFIAEALRSEDVAAVVEVCHAYSAACLVTGKTQRARTSVRYLMRFRRAPMGELRFRANLTLGDFHAQCERIATDSRESAVERSRAVRAWAAADSEAVSLDNLLDTRQRHHRMARRWERLRPRERA